MTLREQDPQTFRHRAWVAWRRGRRTVALNLRRNPITAATVIALAVSSLALVLVLGEQSDGRTRDHRLAKTQDTLTEAVQDIEGSRIESARTTCRFNGQQNRVILAILSLSYKNPVPSRDPATQRRLVAEAKALTRPLTAKAQKRLCRGLIAGIRSSTPPPGP